MKNQRKYWDKVATDKEFTTTFKLDLFSKYVSKDNSVLDYGCGYGRTLYELKENGYKNILGADFSKEMIFRGKKQYPSIDFKVIDSRRIPFDDNSFDSVLLLAVLTCIYKDCEQDKILEEIKRVLKPTGIIYINDFLLNQDKRNMDRYEKYKDKYGTYGVFELEEGAIVRHHNDDWISKISIGFEDLVIEKMEFITMNGNKSNGIIYIGKNKK